MDNPIARATDPDTSHEAAEYVTDTGIRAAQCRRVADAVRRFPGRTSNELSDASGIDRYTIARRLPELEPAHVTRGDARTCRISGRRALTWEPTTTTTPATAGTEA
jgi:hypothetical protein